MPHHIIKELWHQRKQKKNTKKHREERAKKQKSKIHKHLKRMILQRRIYIQPRLIIISHASQHARSIGVRFDS